MQENLAWAPGSVREQRDSDCVVCWRDATWANYKVSAALGESPSEMLLDVGSNPTASTNIGSGHDWPELFLLRQYRDLYSDSYCLDNIHGSGATCCTQFGVWLFLIAWYGGKDITVHNIVLIFKIILWVREKAPEWTEPQKLDSIIKQL